MGEIVSENMTKNAENAKVLSKEEIMAALK